MECLPLHKISCNNFYESRLKPHIQSLLVLRPMIINLKKIKVYLISPATGKYTDRAVEVFKRLIAQGFERVELYRSVVDIASGLNSLNKTNIAIFEQELRGPQEPFIIIEDDCGFTGPVPDELEIPDDCDAFYLGLAKWVYPHSYETLGRGYHIRENKPEDVEDIGAGLVRLRGFTSTHAVLYFSRTYMEEFIRRMKPLTLRQDNIISLDLVFATMQPQSKVYALKNTLCFQDKLLGGQEDVTRISYNGSCFR